MIKGATVFVPLGLGEVEENGNGIIRKGVKKNGNTHFPKRSHISRIIGDNSIPKFEESLIDESMTELTLDTLQTEQTQKTTFTCENLTGQISDLHFMTARLSPIRAMSIAGKNFFQPSLPKIPSLPPKSKNKLDPLKQPQTGNNNSKKNRASLPFDSMQAFLKNLEKERKENKKKQVLRRMNSDISLSYKENTSLNKFRTASHSFYQTNDSDQDINDDDDDDPSSVFITSTKHEAPTSQIRGMLPPSYSRPRSADVQRFSLTKPLAEKSKPVLSINRESIKKSLQRSKSNVLDPKVTKLNKCNFAATTIQHQARGFLCRNRYLRFRRSICVLQRRLRSFCEIQQKLREEEKERNKPKPIDFRNSMPSSDKFLERFVPKEPGTLPAVMIEDTLFLHNRMSLHVRDTAEEETNNNSDDEVEKTESNKVQNKSECKAEIDPLPLPLLRPITPVIAKNKKIKADEHMARIMRSHPAVGILQDTESQISAEQNGDSQRIAVELDIPTNGFKRRISHQHHHQHNDDNSDDVAAEMAALMNLEDDEEHLNEEIFSPSFNEEYDEIHENTDETFEISIEDIPNEKADVNCEKQMPEVIPTPPKKIEPQAPKPVKLPAAVARLEERIAKQTKDKAAKRPFKVLQNQGPLQLLQNRKNRLKQKERQKRYKKAQALRRSRTRSSLASAGEQITNSNSTNII
eukprot:TRINITY_DN5883_c0_g1_i1.p1 TRINITY_DN5883_c0_g1~~TRINITY_DN5883_c0_g1_i1.p1  ORF type:complete len:690 (-),score=161.89 TRINITY_DN5883_c0_g1_i1:168-2237(-)